MYESPIVLTEKIDKISNNFGEKLDEYVMEFVSSYGVDVDKEELIKALKYDRDQYDKGFKDGYEKGVEVISSQTILNMPSAQPEPHWIPCSERLPDDGQLIYASFQYLQCCQVVEYSTYIRDAIDAWIPLPESYERK